MQTLSDKYQKEYIEKFGKVGAKKKKLEDHVRRYYIHSRLKGFIDVEAEKRIIFVPVGFIPPTFQNYINELQDKFNYTIQMIIR